MYSFPADLRLYANLGRMLAYKCPVTQTFAAKHVKTQADTCMMHTIMDIKGGIVYICY